AVLHIYHVTVPFIAMRHQYTLYKYTSHLRRAYIRYKADFLISKIGDLPPTDRTATFCTQWEYDHAFTGKNAFSQRTVGIGEVWVAYSLVILTHECLVMHGSCNQ